MLVLGISGAPGSGKSTLCRTLEDRLAHEGLRAVTLSLDDLYLTAAERRRLARNVHPLCGVRGTAGTHDVALGIRTITALRQASPQDRTPLPRFDKATDDRHRETDAVRGRPDVLLFEGWLVGVPPAPPWTGPTNEREAREDPDGDWARWSLRALSTDYPPLWRLLDGLLFIEVPSYEAVLEGRWRQEEALRARRPDAGGTMTRAEVDAFMALFERLTCHANEVMPELADLCAPAWQPGGPFSPR